MKLTFVTVVFEPEISLLKLQARSMSINLLEDDIEDIIVILNSNRAASIRRLERVRSLYGSLAQKVTLLSSNEVSSISGAEGWIAQQILKLEISRRVRSSFYVVLDAKTHLIRPLSTGFIISPSGKPYINAYSYKEHGLLGRLEVCLLYMGLDGRHTAFFTTSVPPFTIYTQDAMDLLSHVEVTSGRSFAEAFLKHDLTEFFLYTSWIIKRYGGFTERYEVDDRVTTTIWEHRTDPATVANDIGRGGDSPFMSVHRRAFLKLPRETIAILAEVWTTNRLFDSTLAAKIYIRKFQLSYILPFCLEYGKKKVSQARSRLRL